MVGKKDSRYSSYPTPTRELAGKHTAEKLEGEALIAITSNFSAEFLFVCVLPAVLGIIVTDPPPEYKYSYEIDDPTTGDTKSQYEVRQGGTVSGAYSVVDPDGTKRTVEYTADPKEGFKAVVRKEPAETPQKVQQHVPEGNTYFDYQYEPQYQPKPDYVTDVRMEDSRHQQTQYYDKVDYVQQPVYFRPENELTSEDQAYAHGQYFIPNQN
ncbi:cuticular protein RR-2 motif 72 [Aphomia sociella]